MDPLRPVVTDVGHRRSLGPDRPADRPQAARRVGGRTMSPSPIALSERLARETCQQRPGPTHPAVDTYTGSGDASCTASGSVARLNRREPP